MATSTAIHHHHHHHSPQQQYPSPPTSSPSSLISTRPILPLPKRRVHSTTTSSSSATSSSTTTVPPPPPQIFSHTYLPAAGSTKPTPAYIQQGDYETSDSEDEGDDAGSTVSSVGREDLNLKNKKKRKIPLSATSAWNVSIAVADVGSPVYTITRTGNLKGRLNGWRIPSATIRPDGGYIRRKTRVSSRSLEAEEVEQESLNGLITGKKTSEEVDASRPTSPAPSGPFSFTCASPLKLPLVPPATPVATTSQCTYPVPSVPPTTPLPVPPPPPAAKGQENIPPQQPCPPSQQQQQQQPPTQLPLQQTQRLPPQGMKHPKSEKARRVAQLTKLRERYRTGPKPETDEIYICQFCTYGFIYGEDPVYLVKQYNRKRNAEMRLRRERRKMLEKARLKGKKGQTNSKSKTGGGGGNDDEEFEDDGLCCTCGQKVGQHNHVPAGGTQSQQQPQPQGVGQGPGKGK